MTPKQMFEMLKHTGNQYSYFKKGTKYVHFSTGGWSENEELINELKNERIFYHLHCKWESGGHYKFRIPPKELMNYDFKKTSQISKEVSK